MHNLFLGHRLAEHTRRSLNYETVTVEIPVPSENFDLRIQLPAFGKTLTLVLHPNLGFLPQRFVLEYRSAVNGTTRTANVERYCYYSGTVDGQMLSRVAVSTCRGLTGFVRTETEEIFIRPKHRTGPRHTVSQHWRLEHVIYRTLYEPSADTNEDSSLDQNRFGKHDPNRLDKSAQWLDQQQTPTGSIVFIETLLVADNSMLQGYGYDGLFGYVLSRMNEAAAIFRSDSISVNIQLVITQFIVLEDEQSPLKIGRRAGKTLANFCSWKNTCANLSSHDVAVFLSRNSICSELDGSCRDQGLAFSGGMCMPDHACAIVQDKGLHLGHVLAHEIGHTMGMLHDEDAGCPSRNGKFDLMTSSLSTTFGAIDWSPCSQRSLLAFIHSGKGDCLYNIPVSVRMGTFSRSLAARSLDELCLLMAGPNAKPCYRYTSDGTSCSGVWCNTSTAHQCVLFQGADIDGLTCDAQKACKNGSCVAEVWSEWSSFSLCSATCGQGLQYQERHCLGNNNDCQGKSRRYQICQAQPCPLGSEDPRIYLCSLFNDRIFKDGKYYNWVPHLAKDPGMECELMCKPTKGTFFSLMAPSVPLGTACVSNHDGVCVGESCQTVGCDGVIGSQILKDACGVCGGDGSSCNIVSGTFQRTLTYGYYHKVVVLPIQSEAITIKEIGMSPNFIAVRSGRNSNRYYVNGNWHLSRSGVYPAVATSIFYRRIPELSEAIWIRGPIKEPLVIMVLTQDSKVNVFYQYKLTRNASGVQSKSGLTSRYMWRFTVWTNCSQQCSGGTQTRQIVCHDTKTEKDVEQKHCHSTPVPHSVQLSRPCNVEPCSPKWSVGPWDPKTCPETCGVPQTRKRDVYCIIHDSPTTTRVVRNRLCNEKSKPASKETCHVSQCPSVPGDWFAGPWGACSVSCGEGQRNRLVLCVQKRSYTMLPSSTCDPASKPSALRPCTMPPCVSMTESGSDDR
jgi:hypothetical protein